jgi:hypothetical protein
MKKYILSIAILFVLLLASAIFLPYLFKDKIIEAVKNEANKSLKVELNFNPNIGINVFKSFPNLNLSFKDLSLIYPNGTFKNDTLLFTDRLEVSFDLMKFYKEQQYIFKSIAISKPFIHLESQNDSTVNWDISREDDTTQSESINFELAKFEINHGRFEYLDVPGKIDFRLYDMNHNSNGDFNENIFKLASKSEIAEVLMIYDGITYLNKWGITQNGDIDVNLAESKYTLTQNILTINGLEADLDGSIAMTEEDIIFDVKTSSSSPDLNKFLTLIPAIYTSDFNSMQTKGSANLSASFKGTYNDLSFPAFDVQMNIENGWFKYPDLPLPAEDINLDLHIFSKDGNIDKTVVDISQLHLKMANDPFDIKLNMQDIFGNSLIDTELKGNLNLSNLTKIIPLENTTLSGFLVSDAAIRGRISDIESAALDKFSATGKLTATNVIYKTPDMNEALQLYSAQILLANQNIIIPTFDAKLGKNDVQFSGKFENFYSYLFKDKTLTGNGNLTSKNLDLNDFLTEDSEGTATEMTLVEIPGNLNMLLSTSIDKLVYDDLTLTNFTGTFGVDNKTATMQKISTQFLGGKLDLNGAYQYDIEKPNANFEVSYSDIKIKDLLSKFKVIKAFAPIADRVNALTTAKLSFSSLLNNDMSPKLENVTLGGSINLKNIVVDQLEVLKNIDSKLGSNHLNVSKIQDLFVKFNIKDGKLLVAPFDLFLDSSTLHLEGVSKLDGSLNYDGLLSIPGSYIKNETKVINGLIKDSKFTNLQIKPSDFLKIAVKIGGKFSKPEVKLNLAEIKSNFKQTLKTAISSEVDKKKTEAKTTASNKLNNAKEDAKKKAEEAKAKALSEIAQKKKEAEVKIKQEAENRKRQLKAEADKKLKGLLKK